MSHSNGTNGVKPADVKRLLEEKRELLELRQTEARLRNIDFVEKKQKKLLESFENYDFWLNGYSDVVDRFSAAGTDFYSVISHANDVRNGDNWPFWRSWQEHARIRFASRLLYGTSGLVRGAIKNVGGYVVGDGMKARAAARHEDAPKPLMQAVQAWLDDWETDNDFHDVQIECFDRHQMDGEYFLRITPQKDGWTLVRIIEPMFVIDPVDMDQAAGKYGVITDPNDLWDVRGFNVSYDGNAGNSEYISSSEMRQHRANVRRQVKRGMPTISFNTLELYKIVDRLLVNMGTGAAIQAAIAFARQHKIAPQSAVSDFVGGLADYTQTNPLSGKMENVQQLRAGTVVDMDEGQEFVKSPFAENVQNFAAAVQALLRACGVVWGAPEGLISSDSSNNNFASALVAEAPFVKRCKQEQAKFKSMFQWAITSALKHYCNVKRGIKAAGRVWGWPEVSHYLDIQVTPPTVEVRNRQEEASLNREYITLGVKSRQTAAQELGLDFEREALNNRTFEETYGEQGIPSKERAGPGGGGSDDPFANTPGNRPADIGIAAVNRNGDSQPDAGAEDLPGGISPDQQPGAAQQQPQSSADDVLASAGLDDLFDSLDVPDNADEASAPEDEAEGGGDPNHLRATVGGLKSLADLQAAVYGGELPREAAIANAKLMLGFSEDEAASLFPDVLPQNTADSKSAKAHAKPQTPTGEAMNFVEQFFRRAGSGLSGRAGVESLMESVRYTRPNVEREREEAARYDEFRDDPQAWERAVARGNAVPLSSLRDVGNVDSDLASLAPEKVARVQNAILSGRVEMPIVGRWPGGKHDLIAGNTRVASLLARGVDPQVWVIEVPGTAPCESDIEDVLESIR